MHLAGGPLPTGDTKAYVKISALPQRHIFRA